MIKIKLYLLNFIILVRYEFVLKVINDYDIVYQSFNSVQNVLLSFVIILDSNIIASLLILIIALEINNFTSFSTFETLYGVVIGFFTGVYIPIGYYPLIIRNVFFYFPLCQTTSLLRNI